MSQISLKSISGITSITTPAGVDNRFSLYNFDSTERLVLDHSGNLNISGISSATNFKTGSSNLHSTGLNVGNTFLHTTGVEAAGINVLGADTPIGLGATIYNSGAAVFTGVVTATQFKGDGSQLSGIVADKIFEGNTEAEVVDGGSDGHFKVKTEGSERLRITSAGRVGINTNNPQALLEIQDRSVGTLIGLSVGTQYGNASFGGYNNYPAIMNNIGVPLLYCDTNNDRTILFGDAVGFGTTCAIRVNNAERLRIDSNGNARLGPGGNNTNSTNYTTLTISNTAGGVVEFLDSGNNNIAGDIIGAEGSGMYISSKQDTPIIFRTGASNSEKVRIDSSGNLMIGMTNGSKKFSVKEASTSSGVYYNQLIGGSSHLAGYAVGIAFDPEGYAARTKMALVAEGIGQGYSRGKFHFLLDAANDSGEATLSEARMTINDSGQVTKPNQPSFAAYAAQNGYTISSTFPFNATRHNIGSHFNTGNYRFTAPVAGKYLFTFTSILASSVTNGYYSIRVNGSGGKGQYVHVTKSNSNWNYCANSWIFNLNANDYVTMYSDSSLNWHGNDWQLFCGELLS